MRFTKTCMISLAAMTLSAATANSAVLTDFFSGVVTSSTFGPPVGETLTGSLTYDTSTDTLTSIGDSFAGQVSNSSYGAPPGIYTSTASVTAGSADFGGKVLLVIPLNLAATDYDVSLGAFSRRGLSFRFLNHRRH